MRESTYQGAGIVDASASGASALYAARMVFKEVAVIISIRIGVRDSCRLFSPDRSFQHVEELGDARFLSLGGIALATKQSGIELFDQQSILKSLNHPIENRNHHLDIEVAAEFTPFEPKAYEVHPSVRIVSDHKSINLAAQAQVSTVLAEQVDAVRNPVFTQHVLDTHQPVIKHAEKTTLPHFVRHV